MTDNLDIQHLQQWIGRTETLSDVVTAAPIAALAATLDRDDPRPQTGDAVPPLWHWLYFLPIHRQSELGSDGHAARGGFLPPVPLPRRMWAGSRLEFIEPMRVGDSIKRTSRIADVRLKEGRTGPLVFVVVRHEIHSTTKVLLTEEHDIVYRGLSTTPGQPPAAPADHIWERLVTPDDVLLFRYSALTFNGHRIHYDRRYAIETEGYPGLVVHGPLIATLLVDLLRRSVPNVAIRRFAFRAVSPLFDTAPFAVCGRPEGDGGVRVWARGPAGALAMDGSATLGNCV